jgi:hypothetical protein
MASPLNGFFNDTTSLANEAMLAYLIRTVSGEGHLNGKNPPPKEASTRIRLLIYTNTPIQINS